jgi:hypothetical protein
MLVECCKSIKINNKLEEEMMKYNKNKLKTNINLIK